MDPVFIYWPKIKFKGENNFKEFKVTFSNGDNLDGVIFKKNKDYYITSLSANININKDLKELKDYEKIKEISKISNSIIEKGILHLYKDMKLDINLKNIDKLTPDKTKRRLSVKSLEFFDEEIKKKKNSFNLFAI